MNPIKIPENIINGYPNNGFLENVGSTSETIPIAGKIKIYTSGWPKTQNKCCHKRGSPPAPGAKNCVPNILSKASSIKAIVITGIAVTSSMDVINAIQVNTGILIKVIPGALMFIIVTRKFKPPATDETPRTSNPSE